MLVRFDVHPDLEGHPDRDGWTVYDRITGKPAAFDGFAAVGLSCDDAEEIADLLNTLTLLQRTPSPVLH